MIKLPPPQFFRFDGEKLDIVAHTYNITGCLALIAQDAITGEPWATLSVNMSEEDMASLEPWQFFLKDYSENTMIAEEFIQCGLIEPAGFGAIAGFEMVEAYNYLPALPGHPMYNLQEHQS